MERANYKGRINLRKQPGEFWELTGGERIGQGGAPRVVSLESDSKLQWLVEADSSLELSLTAATCVRPQSNFTHHCSPLEQRTAGDSPTHNWITALSRFPGGNNRRTSADSPCIAPMSAPFASRA